MNQVYTVGKEFIWTHKTEEGHMKSFILRKFHQRVVKAMKKTKTVSDFQKSSPIDCDYLTFLQVFGNFQRYLHKKNKRPRNVEKDNVKMIRTIDEYELVIGSHPSIKNEKRNIEGKIIFPMIICYNTKDEVLFIQMKYKFYNMETGREILSNRQITSSNNNIISQRLRRLTQ